MVRDLLWDKAKPYNKNVEKLTNNLSEISKIYSLNHNHQFPGGLPNADDRIRKFFSNKELGIRFLIYRDEINKSRRRGEVPFDVLYDNVRHEDRVLNFID